MNYCKIYSQLILHAQLRGKIDGYKERHHILPKALGGSNSKENLVELTAREHFIAHMLLSKIHGGSMWYAVIRMVGQTPYKNSRLYLIARKQYSQVSKSLSKQREKLIADKRTYDPSFDAHIFKIRSEATKFRKEGYQKNAAILNRQKFDSDPDYAKRISEIRRKAAFASHEKRRKDGYGKISAEGTKKRLASYIETCKIRSLMKSSFERVENASLA